MEGRAGVADVSSQLLASQSCRKTRDLVRSSVGDEIFREAAESIPTKLTGIAVGAADRGTIS